MNTKAYIKHFKLDLEDQYLNYNDFLAEFSKDFLERVDLTIKTREVNHLDFPFKLFNQIVKEAQDKFNQISKKKAGPELPESLWKAFYAQHVIPLRAKLFPDKHKEITQHWEKQKMKDQEK